MSNNGDDQVDLYYASTDNLRATISGFEPFWMIVPAPHTRCGDVDKAKSTVTILKRLDSKFDKTIFKAVRIRDSVEMFNEFKMPLP